MKLLFASVLVGYALGLSVQGGEVSGKISGVHLCCKSCVTGVEKAVGEVQGATATVDKDAGTVVLSGPNPATMQKAADALVAAGYFGKSSDGKINLGDKTGAQGKKVSSLQVSGVHLCCSKCVKALDEAIKTVPGAKSHTAEKGAKTFEVTGDFNDKELFEALHNAGLSGKVGN